MVRLIPSLLALGAAMLIAPPAFAADYRLPCCGDDNGGGGGGGGLRTAYGTEPADWTSLGDQTDPLKFEFGLRYWYSMGAQHWTDNHGSFQSNDTSHIVEGDLRIEDHSTNSFATALAGYSVRTDGSYSDPFGSGTISDGHVGYLGADFGWNAWGDHNGSGIGALVGYMYWNDSPNTTRASFTTAESASDVSYDPTTGATSFPMDSKPNNVDINLLRLGVQGKADMGFADITGSLAAVPYANISGVLGSDRTATSLTPLLNIGSIKASETDISGWGYGAMADVMLRAHPTKNLTIGIGGRAWYLQGTVDAQYDQATIGDPSDSDGANPPAYDTPPTFSKQRFIDTANPFSLFRYGLLAEVSYAF